LSLLLHPLQWRLLLLQLPPELAAPAAAVQLPLSRQEAAALAVLLAAAAADLAAAASAAR
jgi:hypothetical protein